MLCYAGAAEPAMTCLESPANQTFSKSTDSSWGRGYKGVLQMTELPNLSLLRPIVHGTEPKRSWMFFIFSDIQEAQRQKDSERRKCLKKTDRNTTQSTMYHPQSKRKFSKQRERGFFFFFNDQQNNALLNTICQPRSTGSTAS